MTKADLRRYLIEEAEYRPSTVDNMDAYNMIDAYLRYEGIVGYTSSIIEVIEAATGKKLKL